MFTNKLVRSINTKTLVNITIVVFRHGTENFEEYFIPSKLSRYVYGKRHARNRQIDRRDVTRKRHEGGLLTLTCMMNIND